MAYQPGTTLKRVAPHGEDPYDEVRVIGRNPISTTSGQRSEWEGELGDEIVITPYPEFGANIPLPVGQLDSEYEIVEIPDEKPHARPEPDVIPAIDDEADSPERKLRAAEEAAGIEESEQREETPLAATG